MFTENFPSNGQFRRAVESGVRLICVVVAFLAPAKMAALFRPR
jgi:hypothetical protein